MGARGYHHLGGKNARVYYLKHHFDSQVFTLQKEHQHGGNDGEGNEGYATIIHSNPLPSMEDDTWYGFKLVVRSKGSDVLLQGYRDETDGKYGGVWEKIIEFTDDGTWLHKRLGSVDSGMGKSHPPIHFGTSCFVRTDDVKNFLINRFSIRTIESIGGVIRDHRNTYREPPPTLLNDDPSREYSTTVLMLSLRSGGFNLSLLDIIQFLVDFASASFRIEYWYSQEIWDKDFRLW